MGDIRFSEPPRLSAPSERFVAHGGWPFRVYLETGMPPVFGKENACVEGTVDEFSSTGVVSYLRLFTSLFPKQKKKNVVRGIKHAGGWNDSAPVCMVTLVGRPVCR
jgi:hypothetical protein